MEFEENQRRQLGMLSSIALALRGPKEKFMVEKKLSYKNYEDSLVPCYGNKKLMERVSSKF